MIKMKDGNGMINISIQNDHNEALLQWSENLTALGRTLRWLNEHPDGENALVDVAPQLGYIIEDYANMINQVCSQAYCGIGRFFDQGKHTLVCRAGDIYADLKEDPHASPAAICQINGIIEEMKPVLIDASLLKEYLSVLEKIKKTMEQKLNPESHAPISAAGGH